MADINTSPYKYSQKLFYVINVGYFLKNIIVLSCFVFNCYLYEMIVI